MKRTAKFLMEIEVQWSEGLQGIALLAINALSLDTGGSTRTMLG